MPWRDQIPNVIVGLIVTVLGGLLVWGIQLYGQYSKAPVEIRQYSETLASMDVETGRISVVKFGIENKGNEAARDVVAIVSFPDRNIITQKKLVLSSGQPETVELLSSKENELKFRIASLLPTERITGSLLISGSEVSQPLISVKSQEALGQLISADEFLATSNNKLSFLLLLGAIVGTLFAQYFIGKKLPILQSALRGLNLTTKSPNNAAFIFLHSGNASDARTILENVIFSKPSGPYEMSNYGSSLALTGQADKAAIVASGALWWAKADHEKCIANFNCAIVHFVQKDWDAGILHLRTALSLNQQEIVRYCQFSAVIRESARECFELKSLLDKLLPQQKT